MNGFASIAEPADAVVVQDPAELAAFLSDDRGAHVYGLADLDEPFWSGSRWFRRGDAVVGLVGLPSGEGLAAYGVSTRAPDATLALLVDLAPELPAGLLLTGPVGLGPALAPVRPLAWTGRHHRYVLADPEARPAPAGHDVVHLGVDDLDAVLDLYRSEPGAAFFRPHMLADDSFVGVVDRGELVACAGTHVLSEERGVAALGAVFVRPSHRGRALGRRVSRGVLRRLSGRVEVIGLNVAEANVVAQRIYASLGFERVLDYDEAEFA